MQADTRSNLVELVEQLLSGPVRGISAVFDSRSSIPSSGLELADRDAVAGLTVGDLEAEDVTDASKASVFIGGDAKARAARDLPRFPVQLGLN